MLSKQLAFACAVLMMLPSCASANALDDHAPAGRRRLLHMLRGGNTPVDADPPPSTGAIDEEDSDTSAGPDQVDPIFGQPVEIRHSSDKKERVLTPVQYNTQKTDDFLRARDLRHAELAKQAEADRLAAQQDPVGHFQVYRTLGQSHKSPPKIPVMADVPQAITGIQGAMETMFPPETLITFQAMHHETTKMACMLNPEFPPCKTSRYSPQYKKRHEEMSKKKHASWG